MKNVKQFKEKIYGLVYKKAIYCRHEPMTTAEIQVLDLKANT